MTSCLVDGQNGLAIADDQAPSFSKMEAFHGLDEGTQSEALEAPAFNVNDSVKVRP
jgi:hypothetical protein